MQERVESEGKSRLCRMSPLKPPPYVRFSALPHGVLAGGGGGKGGGGVLIIIHSNVRH